MSYQHRVFGVALRMLGQPRRGRGRRPGDVPAGPPRARGVPRRGPAGHVALRDRLPAVPEPAGGRPAAPRAQRRGRAGPGRGRRRRRRRGARARRAGGRAARGGGRIAGGPTDRGRAARPRRTGLRGDRRGPRAAAEHGPLAPAPGAAGPQGQAGAMATMTCQEIRELFSARVDDALSSEERATVDAHLATCAECAREWDRFAHTVGLLRAVAPARAPIGFVDRVLAARPQPWYRRLARRRVPAVAGEGAAGGRRGRDGGGAGRPDLPALARAAAGGASPPSRRSRCRRRRPPRRG